MKLTNSKWVNDSYERFKNSKGYYPLFLDVYNSNEITDVAITLSTRSNGAMGSGTILKLERNNNMYRVRKLTPRECGRLMGVEDKDIDNILKTVSNSQAYKQFGNSIVVDVLAEMFKNIFTDVPTPITNKDADDLDTLSIYELLEKLGGE